MSNIFYYLLERESMNVRDTGDLRVCVDTNKNNVVKCNLYFAIMLWSTTETFSITTTWLVFMSWVVLTILRLLPKESWVAVPPSVPTTASWRTGGRGRTEHVLFHTLRSTPLLSELRFESDKFGPFACSFGAITCDVCTEGRSYINPRFVVR